MANAYGSILAGGFSMTNPANNKVLTIQAPPTGVTNSYNYQWPATFPAAPGALISSSAGVLSWQSGAATLETSSTAFVSGQMLSLTTDVSTGNNVLQTTGFANHYSGPSTPGPTSYTSGTSPLYLEAPDAGGVGDTVTIPMFQVSRRIGGSGTTLSPILIVNTTPSAAYPSTITIGDSGTGIVIATPTVSGAVVPLNVLVNYTNTITSSTMVTTYPISSNGTQGTIAYTPASGPVTFGGMTYTPNVNPANATTTFTGIFSIASLSANSISSISGSPVDFPGGITVGNVGIGVSPGASTNTVRINANSFTGTTTGTTSLGLSNLTWGGLYTKSIVDSGTAVTISNPVTMSGSAPLTYLYPLNLTNTAGTSSQNGVGILFNGSNGSVATTGFINFSGIDMLISGSQTGTQGGVYVGGNVKCLAPITTLVVALGLSANRWGSLYTKSITDSGTAVTITTPVTISNSVTISESAAGSIVYPLTISNAAGGTTLNGSGILFSGSSSGTATSGFINFDGLNMYLSSSQSGTQGSVYIASNVALLLPQTTLAVSLGGISKRWAGLYTGGISDTGSAVAITNPLSLSGSAAGSILAQLSLNNLAGGSTTNGCGITFSGGYGGNITNAFINFTGLDLYLSSSQSGTQGSVYIASNVALLLPQTTLAVSLGRAANRWNGLYTASISDSGTAVTTTTPVTMSGSAANSTLYQLTISNTAGGSTTNGSGILFTGAVSSSSTTGSINFTGINLILSGGTTSAFPHSGVYLGSNSNLLAPQTNLGASLGSSGNTWAQLYTAQLYTTSITDNNGVTITGALSVTYGTDTIQINPASRAIEFMQSGTDHLDLGLASDLATLECSGNFRVDGTASINQIYVTTGGSPSDPIANIYFNTLNAVDPTATGTLHWGQITYSQGAAFGTSFSYCVAVWSGAPTIGTPILLVGATSIGLPALVSTTDNTYKYGSSGWISVSDQRLKQDIVDHKEGLDTLNRLRVRKFRYIADVKKDPSARTQVGVIAQEVLPVYPQAIHSPDVNEFYGVDANSFIYLLINSVQELSRRVDALQKIVDARV